MLDLIWSICSAESADVPSGTVLKTVVCWLCELAAKLKLPSIYEFREGPEQGGLMSYGANLTELFSRAASFVDKILKGAKPGDLPMEQPTRFELVLNRGAAKALGVNIPPTPLQRVDEFVG